MKNLQRIAKGIRMITVPPVMVLFLSIALYAGHNTIFLSNADVAAAIILLGIVPILAYPMQKWIPGFQDKGREGQRKLAFIFNIIGYFAAWGYGLFTHVSPELQMLFTAYLLSVLLLSATNQLLKIRASGHACSTVAPVFFAGYFLDLGWALLFLVIAAASIWASVYLKRHRPREIAVGIIVFICSFFMAVLFS